MSLLKRFVRFISTTLEGLIKGHENRISCLEYELKKKVKILDKIKENLIGLQGQKRKLIKDKEELERVIVDLDTATQKAISKGKEDLAKDCFNLMEGDKKRVKIYTDNIEMTNKIEEKVNKQVLILDTVIRNLRTKIDSLKLKENFSDNVKKINKTLNINTKGLNLTEVDTIEDDIDLDYNIAEIKAENIEKASESDLDKLLNNDKFEEYKKSLTKGDE